MSTHLEPPWMQITSPNELADRIVELYQDRGDERYSESVTQVEHALQCGALAEEAGATAETTLAAYLHDVGHLLLRAHERREENWSRDLHHEEVGARFLSNWLGEAVTVPVALHVPAKRYLCATDDGYFETLSPASVRSLELQGGPMSSAEAEAFIELPGAEDAVALRRWDDLGKVPGADTPTLERVSELVVALADVG